MSASRLVTIFCDAEDEYGNVCSRWSEAGVGDNAREARAGAKSGGWIVAQPGGKDYCPAHAAPPPPAVGEADGGH